MNLSELLNAHGIGLFDSQSERVRWFDSTAKDVADSWEVGDDDFEVIVLCGIDEDYVNFRADAEVGIPVGESDTVVNITDMRGRTHDFECYRVLTIDEIFCL